MSTTVTERPAAAYKMLCLPPPLARHSTPLAGHAAQPAAIDLLLRAGHFSISRRLRESLPLPHPLIPRAAIVIAPPHRAWCSESSSMSVSLIDVRRDVHRRGDGTICPITPGAAAAAASAGSFESRAIATGRFADERGSILALGEARRLGH